MIEDLKELADKESVYNRFFKDAVEDFEAKLQKILKGKLCALYNPFDRSYQYNGKIENISIEHVTINGNIHDDIFISYEIETDTEIFYTDLTEVAISDNLDELKLFCELKNME